MLFVRCKSSRSGVATVETAHGPATVGLIADSTGDGCVRSAGTMTSRTGRCERRDFSGVGVDRRGLRTQATYVPRPFASVGVGRATDGDVIKLLTDGNAASASAAAAAAGKSLVTHGVTSR